MKLKTVIQISLCIAIFAFLSSCEHDPLFEEMEAIITPTDTTGNNGGTNQDKPCDPDTIYFTRDIQPLLQSNCAFSGCHGNGSAQDGVDLTNYNSIISTADVRPFDLNGSDLYESITETDLRKRMPPPPANALSSDQIAKIAKWINQGALNNSCDGCDTTNVTFSLNISPLIQSNCQGCHSGGSPSGGVSLTNYNQIQAQAITGKLFGTVNHSPGFKAMPFNQPKLSQCKIDQIRIWVNEGAQNN